MSARYSRLAVHDGGGMQLHIPVVDVGPGRPVMAVVAGIHGDEPSPLVLVDRFLRALQDRPLRAGIRVIAAANPPALLSRTRFGPWDHVDMNRCGDDVDRPGVTRAFARGVAESLQGVSLSVNLHNFVMRTPLLGILPPELGGERAVRHRRWMRCLDPQVVWCIRPSAAGRRVWLSSLDHLLERQGVDTLAVEMSELPEAMDQLDRALAGLMRLAVELGCLDGEQLPLRRDAVRIDRHLTRAPGAGIFEPGLPLMAEVRPGDVLGQLIPLERPGERRPVLAHHEGLLIQQRRIGFVRPGDDLAAVGTRQG